MSKQSVNTEEKIESVEEVSNFQEAGNVIDIDQVIFNYENPTSTSSNIKDRLKKKQKDRAKGDGKSVKDGKDEGKSVKDEGKGKKEFLKYLPFQFLQLFGSSCL